MKKEDEDALIIGEVWEDATNKFAYGIRRRYLLGKQLDSVMNYPWRTAIINYVKTGNGASFCDEVLAVEENYPKPAIDCLMNIISTHDTERIINATGTERRISREEAASYVMSDEEIKRGIDGALASMFLLFSLPGIACVYYGDEVGTEGFSDPYCRKGYPYGKENFEILNWVKELASLRKKYSEDFDCLVEKMDVSGGAVSFERGNLLFAINMSDRDEIITKNDDFVIICNKNEVKFMNKTLTIPQKSYGVLVRKNR